MVSTSFLQFHIVHLHYGTSRTICWKPWMLSRLFSEHIVEQNIERLGFLPPAQLSKLNVPEKTYINRKESGGISCHRVCSGMAFPLFFSELRMSGFCFVLLLMSHIRIFFSYYQIQVFLLTSICQLKKLTKSCLSQFPAALIWTDVMFCFGAETYLSTTKSLWGLCQGCGSF